MTDLSRDASEETANKAAELQKTATADNEWVIVKSRWEKFERVGDCIDHSEVERWAASLQAAATR
ncbi:hypothetical protein [Rhizobium sp. C4]|uniref:hypothetical protein n=1 Tax=Rhizobium sp. C4 TaxID=1349800 RepID=UPI001E3948A7|nr:hypothetical protein [Rhizobium sp. C4]MCD2174155.1 hypothetical protein [Rhizobium sp. C4]